MINKIKKIQKDCKEIGWDGYNASPITKRTAKKAIKFWKTLEPRLTPSEEKTFDMAPGPDNSIVFEYRKDKKIVTISTTNENNYIYIVVYINQSINKEMSIVCNLPIAVEHAVILIEEIN